MHYKTTLHRQLADLTRWGDCQPINLDVMVANTRQHLTQFKQLERMAHHAVGIKLWPDSSPDKITMIGGCAVGNVLYRILEEEEVIHGRKDIAMMLEREVRVLAPSSALVRGNTLAYAGEAIDLIEKILNARHAELTTSVV